MSAIKSIKAIQVLDSRGVPTVACRVSLDNGTSAEVKIPSGASTGSKEALELRDNESIFLGKGVMRAVKNINTVIQPAFIGRNPFEQEKIDNELILLDGTDSKSKLGANSILAVSLAMCRVAAKDKKISLFNYFSNIYKDITGNTVKPSLPMPMLNILNGGEHADNNIDIQEFMIIPKGASSFSEAIRWSSEIYWNLKNILKEKDLSTAVGDEGGFAPSLNSNEDAIKLIIESIEKSNLEAGKDVFLALDCAASEFYKNESYHLEGEGKSMDSEQFANYLGDLVNKYPIISIEDGMDEGDLVGWKLLTEKIGSKCQLVGDDLFVTNPKIFQDGIDAGMANAILIKFNQIGSITETIKTIDIANLNNYASIVSHRSGETEDTTIADLAVGLGVGQIKTGAPCRSDRVAKYNRLLWIEDDYSDLHIG